MQIASGDKNVKSLLSGKKHINLSPAELAHRVVKVNPGLAEPGYALPLQTE